MTRRDYVFLSHVFRVVRRHAEIYCTAETVGGIDLAIKLLANSLKADNEKFEHPRFLADCGIPPIEHRKLLPGVAPGNMPATKTGASYDTSPQGSRALAETALAGRGTSAR